LGILRSASWDFDRTCVGVHEKRVSQYRQIHALLLQQAASKPFWLLFYSNQLNSFSRHKTINL